MEQFNKIREENERLAAKNTPPVEGEKEAETK